METLQSALGIVALLLMAWACSENRRAVSLRQVPMGLGLTFLLAALLLKGPPGRGGFAAAHPGGGGRADAAGAGSSFVFGYPGGAPLPFDSKVPGGEFILALQALPIVLIM